MGKKSRKEDPRFLRDSVGSEEDIDSGPHFIDEETGQLLPVRTNREKYKKQIGKTLGETK